MRAVVGDYPTVPDADDAAATGDDVFDAITSVLRNKTRDQSTFPTVFDERVHYGFWRNCFALRRLGAAIGIVAAACAGVMAGLTGTGAVGGNAANWIIAGVIDVAATLCWLMLRAPRVRIAGDRYAEALLSAVENIPPAQTSRG